MEEHKKDIIALKNAGNTFKELVSDKNQNKGLVAIKVENLSFSIKKRLLLNDLNFEVKSGEIHGFLGPNGAGKTTTIKNLIDAYTTRSKESKITIMGHPVGSVASKKAIAYIPEYAAFPEHLSLVNYLKTMARFSGFSGPNATKKANELMKLLELEPHANINPNKFSSGMKKKVLLAQSLMSDPEVLILDEPAANLDPSARNLLFSALKDLAKTGISIFISSHILAELEGLVTSVTLINNGNIVYSGSLKEISEKINDKKTHKIQINASVEKQAELKKLIHKLKVKIKEEPRYLIISATDKKQLYKVISEIAKNNLDVDKIEFDKVTLQDIYDKEFA